MNAVAPGHGSSRPATTLGCSVDTVWLWPNIPLTFRQGGRVVSCDRDVIHERVARLHGPGVTHSGVAWAVGRAAEHLTDGNVERAERSLSRTALPLVTPDGHRLMCAVGERLGLPIPDIRVGASPRLWSPADIERVARLHVADTLAAWRQIAKFGFDPSEARDERGRWTTGAGSGTEPAAHGGGGRGTDQGIAPGRYTILAGTASVLRNPVALDAALAIGDAVLETAATAAAAITPVGWVVIGAIAVGGVAYLVYHRTTAAAPPSPHPPAILPGRSTTPLPPIQPPGFPASPPVALPNHTASPVEARRPQILTSPGEPLVEEHEVYVGLSPEELAEMRAAHAIMTPEELDRVAGEAAAAAKHARSAQEIRQAVATAANQRAKGDTSSARGTNAHLILNRALKILRDTRNLDHAGEVSYKDGEVVRYGTKGSIRVDIVVGHPGRPERVPEYKTGSEANRLSSRRVHRIRRHLPRGYKHIPIDELRPQP